MIPIFNRTFFVIMFQSRKQFHYLLLKIAANCLHVTYCRFKSVICHLSWKKKKTFKQLPCFILKCAQGVVSNLKESHQSYFMSFSLTWWYNKLIFATDKVWFTLATVSEAWSESVAYVTIQCKSKSGIGSRVGSSTESESEGSEEFLFLPIPFPLPSLPLCRFTLDQNFLLIPTRSASVAFVASVNHP